MKVNDTGLEEEVISLMIRKHVRAGIKLLVAEDFVAQEEKITPSFYTRTLFEKIVDVFVSGHSKLDINVLKASFQSDFALSEDSKNRYVKLVEKYENTVLKSDSAEYFFKKCDQLRQYTSKRILDKKLSEIQTAVQEDNMPLVGPAMSDYLEAISRLSYGRKDEAKILDYKENYEERKNKVAAGDKDENILVTGFPPIDDNCGGLRKGEMCVILGRTSGGKSILMQDITGNIVELGGKSAYYSKEDSAEAVAFRMDSRFTEIEHLKFRRSELTEDEFKMWDDSIKSISDSTLKIVCMGQHFRTSEVKKIHYQLYNMGFEPRLIVLDYIGIMSPSSKGNYSAKYEKLDQIALEIKELAVELDLPVLTAMQLKPEAYNNEEVTFEDVAGAKSISYHADQIFAFIQTDAMRAHGIARIQMLKGRGSGITKALYDVHPNMNLIKINPDWKLKKEE